MMSVNVQRIPFRCSFPTKRSVTTLSLQRSLFCDDVTNNCVGHLFHTGQDSLGLAEGLDLLVHGGLPDLEVLEVEVAGLVQVRLLAGELLQLDVGIIEVLLGV